MPAVAERHVIISRENVHRYDEFLGELRQQFETLAKLTERYPVEVEFKGIRFVFDSKDDITRTIGVIEARLDEFRLASKK